MHMRNVTNHASLLVSFVVAVVVAISSPVSGSDLEDYYHQTGPLAGTLKSDAPLPIYDVDPDHLWNRIFATFYIRPRQLAPTEGQPAMVRHEGGDVIEFLAWGKTTYWSSEAIAAKVKPLLDEFLEADGEALVDDPLRRAMFQRDLWAVFDHLAYQNIHRTGDRTTRARRNLLCRKLAVCIQQLSLPASELNRLPKTYARAIESGAFASRHDFDSTINYLPHGLLDDTDEWVEIDFYYPNMHEDIMDRFISLHARSLNGRSYYRIFYRFPEGRRQVVDYLKEFEAKAIDWKYSAQFGFIPPPKDAPPIPIGTEVVLLQLMMSMDDQMRPVPTEIVESLQFRVFRNIDGSMEPETHTGAGINVLDYRMKRRLLFNDVRFGGLEREPEEDAQYRVAIDGLKIRSPDWGFAGKAVLSQQCVDCHMSPKLSRLGAASIPSLTHSGGFDAGAQMGVSRPLNPDQSDIRGKRVARFKSRDETYRRLLEHLGL